jgi:hypothetical protein
MPVKRFSRKKFPTMMIKIKKSPEGMLYMSLLAIRSNSLAWTAV